MNIHNPDIAQLKILTDQLRELEHPNVPELTELFLGQLIKSVEESIWYTENDYEKLFMRPYMGACGCMGPKNGEPYCGCEMSSYIYEYRYNIALAIQISLRLDKLEEAVYKVWENQ